MLRGIAVAIAGVLMLLSALAHGVLGWPPLRNGLREAHVTEDVINALAVGWYFGSAAMLAFGTIVFIAGVRLRRGEDSGLTAVRTIAVCYVTFGLTAFIVRDFNPFFLLFVFSGLMAGAPLLGRAGRPDPLPGTRGIKSRDAS